MNWYAHSGKDVGKADWQGLAAHLMAVAAQAEETARPFGLQGMAFLAGLLHDLGKYHRDFQRRLEGADIRIDHSTAGAQMLMQLSQRGNRIAAELVSYAVLGHHAGLPDRGNETDACFNRRMERPLDIDPAWQVELSPDLSGLVPDLFRTLPKDPRERDFGLSFMGRMVFSCLVDADFKDTERYYASIGDVEADRDWPPLASLLDDFVARFDAYIARFGAPQDALGRMRSEILAHVRQGADRQPGLFTLTVPTGGGKTLASLGFALDHARRHGHRRIICAIPFRRLWIETAIGCSEK